MWSRSDIAKPSAGLPAIYGAMHLLVDLTTVSVVFRAVKLHELEGRDAFALVLAYDVLAFGTQFLLGLATDRFRAARTATVVGLSLCALAIIGLPLHAVTAMLLASAGNALFHLGAGACVLHMGTERAAPSGVFVAPGALGLGLGLWVGRNPSLGPLWPLLVPLALAAAAAAVVRNPPAASRHVPASATPARSPALAIVALLMLSIAIRSTVGMGASWQLPRSTALLIGIPVAAFAGKAIGGWLSDRLGWIAVSVGALLASAPLIAWGGAHLALLLAGLLLFQMTMPVTLTAAARAVPGKPATAFGLTTLALIAGALPTFFPWGKAWYGNTIFLVLILVSAGAVYTALRLLGRPTVTEPA